MFLSQNRSTLRRWATTSLLLHCYRLSWHHGEYDKSLLPHSLCTHIALVFIFLIEQYVPELKYTCEPPDRKNKTGGNVNEEISDSAGAGSGGSEQVPRGPFVLDLDGDGIELTDLEGSKAYFDPNGDGFATRTSWLSSDEEADGTIVNEPRGIPVDRLGGSQGHRDRADRSGSPLEYQCKRPSGIQPLGRIVHSAAVRPAQAIRRI